MDVDECNAVSMMDLDTIGSCTDTDAVNTLMPPCEALDISHDGLGDLEVFSDIANTIVLATGRCVQSPSQFNHSESIELSSYYRKRVDHQD